MFLDSRVLPRMKCTMLLLTPWLMVSTAWAQAPMIAAIEEGCPTNNAGRLDIDFGYAPWDDCDTEKTCRPTDITNIEVQASPKLGWSAAGLGSNMGFVEAPNKSLSFETYWSPETVSGVCITNFDADDFGRVTVEYVVADALQVPTDPLEFPFNAGMIDNYGGSPEIFVRIYPSDGSPGDGLLLKSAFVEALSRDTEFTVAGLNLSETVTLDCRDNDNESDCVDTGDSRDVVVSGEFDARVYNLTQSDNQTAMAAEFKLERVLTVVDPRDCTNPSSLPGKLLVDLNDGSTQVVSDPIYRVPQGSYSVLIPRTSCGIEVRNKNGTSEQIIRLAIVDSDFLGDENDSVSRITLTEERAETEVELILELAEGDTSAPPSYAECSFNKESPTLLWLPVPPISLDAYDEVPVVVGFPTGTPRPLDTMVEVEADCGSVRGGFLLSLVAWNTEPPAYLVQSLQARKELVQREIEFTDQLNQQTAACLTNGEVTSTFSALLKKLARQIEDNDWTRSIETAVTLEESLDAQDTISSMSNLYWNWDLAPSVIFSSNPVCLEDEPTKKQYEPVGYNQRLWGMVKHLQFQICSRLADGDWSESPALDSACQLLLPEQEAP